LAEAVRLMAEKGPKARALAGGTDILVQLRARRYVIERLVDIKNIREMNELAFSKQKGLTIGAAVPCYLIYQNKEIAANYPGLIDSAALIGGIQIQGRASFGGNLCNAAPSADAIPALIVHGTTARVAGPKGERTVKVEEFCTGPGRNVLQDGEILVSLQVPPPQSHFGANYLRFIPRNEMDIAVAGTGASVLMDNGRVKWARIALASVAPTPVMATDAMKMIEGKEPTAANIEAAAEAAKKAAKPITDMRGTIEQRIHLVGVLTKRALTTAVARAKGAK
jgi:CO/xanthine dehydrogenase FAD-binding subunit